MLLMHEECYLMHDCQCRMAQPGKPHNTPHLIADLNCATLLRS